MDVGNKKDRLPNPRVKANIFEIWTFSWILNLFKIGQKRDLEINDLYEVLNDHKSSTLGSKLEKEWTIELSNAIKTNRKPSLLRVMVRIFGSTLLLYGSIQFFVEVVLRVSQPILIGRLLGYFNRDGSNTTDLKQAYIYATGLLLTILLNILLFHNASLELMHCGMKIRVACCSVIFNKALRLSKSSLGETSVGQVINLLSNDVNRFDIAIRYIQFLFIGPLGTIVVTYFLWQEIGPSSLVGVAGVLVFIPIQGWFGKKTSQFRTKTAPRTDERVKLMNEIISGILVIKMYTWEKPFAYLVQHARKMEIKEIRGTSCISVIVSSFKIFHTRFAMFMSILSYVLLGNYINTHKVFVIISLYNILMTTMTIFFPQAILFSAETLVSIKRIQNFLLRDEKVPSLKSENTSTEGLQMKKLENESVTMNNVDNLKDKEDIIRNVEIVVSNVSAKWIPSQSEYSIKAINLTVRPGRLVAIIGPVGAGKSSLLHAILRELPFSDGNISVRGVVSYASQEPWLFNSSVQQNILFGSPMDSERYKQIIQMCALKTDLEQFPYGDKTIVGEKGVSLSGGQRARINLARAVYKKADIYLLDDPLSAVDTHVGKHLFEKCIKGYLKEKTCILITHQVQYLKSVDKIVLMENAKILAEGSYQKLQSSGLDFFKSLGSSKEIAVTSADDEPRENDETDLDKSSPLCVLSKQDSGGSVSSLIVKSYELDGTKAEPTEVAETCGTGRILSGVYFSYMAAGGSAFKIALLILICSLTQFLITAGDYWITYWVNLEEIVFWKIYEPNKSIKNSLSQVPVLFWWSISRKVCVMVYAILTVATVVFVFIRSGLFVSFFMSVSKNLHNDMFNAITRATMYFFNTNSSGRILNRFTKDIGIIDEAIPIPLLDFVHSGLMLVGVLVVVGVVNVYLMIPTFVIGVLSYRVVVYYLSTSRSIKRLEGVARSPVYAHLNASLQGITTIRAFGAEDILSKEFNVHQDLHSSAWYTFITTSEAFGFSLDMISLIYLSIVTYSFLVVNDAKVFGGDVGLVLTQVLCLTGALQWGIRQAAEMENQMTSVERVLEYTNVPQEAALESSSPDKKPPKEWPNNGKIVFQNLNLRYSPDTPYVLKNLNIIIQPMEKIGIVGRTGAGKSSLIGALFRLAFHEGFISIDDIEIHEIGLHELRSKISIIPQEPVLFSATMRKNLDPFDEFSDHALWNALEEVELKTVVEDLPDGLNSKMSEGGSNFSVGQRQLVCLARAVVRCNKILVLDEATANVDSQTDAMIQNTIKNKFKKFTVLTIAHRLNTVMESDKVLVMDAGTMVEFDHPHNLLQNKNGFFYKMVEQTGQATANLLHNIATESFKTMQMNKKFPIKLIDQDEEDISINKE